MADMKVKKVTKGEIGRDNQGFLYARTLYKHHRQDCWRSLWRAHKRWPTKGFKAEFGSYCGLRQYQKRPCTITIEVG